MKINILQWVRYALFLWLPTVGAAQPEPVVLPEPTGPYAVGTTTWHWADASQPDTLSPDPTDTRAIMVQAWYPARQDTSATPTGYMPLYGGFGHVTAHSVAGAPFAEMRGPAPVLVVTPGRGTTRHFYTALTSAHRRRGLSPIRVIA